MSGRCHVRSPYSVGLLRKRRFQIPENNSRCTLAVVAKRLPPPDLDDINARTTLTYIIELANRRDYCVACPIRPRSRRQPLSYEESTWFPHHSNLREPLQPWGSGSHRRPSCSWISRMKVFVRSKTDCYDPRIGVRCLTHGLQSMGEKCAGTPAV